MAFSIYTAVIFAILKSVSGAADDSECGKATVRYEGVEIPGAGSSLDIEGDWTDTNRISRGTKECEELCRGEPQAKAWSLLYFKNQKCMCFKIVQSTKADPNYHSAKFCDCELKHHSSIFASSSFSLPAYCQTEEGDHVEGSGRSPLSHGTTCNLTCTGSYDGTPGVAVCRARDWNKAESRVIFRPEPRCHLNSTAVLYASIGGGLAVVLVLFLLIVCCLRSKQNRNRRENDDDHHVTMRNVRGGGEGGGNREEDIAVDRRKSYKKATGHLSIDEDSREADLMINRNQEGNVYVNVDLTDAHQQKQRNMAEPTTMIGVPDVDPIYLEGNIANGNEGTNEYIHVNDNRS